MVRRRFTAHEEPTTLFKPSNPLENPKDDGLAGEPLSKLLACATMVTLVFSPRKAIVNGERFEHAMTVDVKDDPSRARDRHAWNEYPGSRVSSCALRPPWAATMIETRDGHRFLLL